MNAAVKYLREREWSMGNGQCPECCGGGPTFLNGFGAWGDRVGHRKNCTMVKALRAAGDTEQIMMDTPIKRRYRRLDLSDPVTRDVWARYSGTPERTTEAIETPEQTALREDSERLTDAWNRQFWKNLDEALLEGITKDKGSGCLK